MRIDLDDLYIYPAHKMMALHHKQAVNATKNLGDFLDWGQTASKWTLLEHQKWINANAKMADPYSSNAIYWRDHFVGMFNLVPAADLYGIQFLYWIRGNFQGNGIATTIAEMLTQKIFLMRMADYVEIHVDQANIASQAVPRKLGFQIEETYTMEKVMGDKGSGTLDVWVQYDPKLVKHRPELVEKAPRTFGWSQASSLLKHLNSEIEQSLINLQPID